jgi:hypothetical protein
MLSPAGDGSSDLPFYADLRLLPGGRKSQVSFGKASDVLKIGRFKQGTHLLAYALRSKTF